MHPSSERILQILGDAGLHSEVRTLADSTRTAAEAAAALGCDVGAIASSLVFLADGAPVVVLTSGAHRVDTALLASQIGQRQSRALLRTRCAPQRDSPSAVWLQ